jgi:hypothetical protein
MHHNTYHAMNSRLTSLHKGLGSCKHCFKHRLRDPAAVYLQQSKHLMSRLADVAGHQLAVQHGSTTCCNRYGCSRIYVPWSIARAINSISTLGTRQVVPAVHCHATCTCAPCFGHTLLNSPSPLINLLLQLIALPHHGATEKLEVVSSNEAPSSLQ